MAFRLSNPN